MPRSKSPTKKVRKNFEFSESIAVKLNRMRIHYNMESEAEVVRYSINLAYAICDLIQDGGDVKYIRKDGSQATLVFK